MANRERGWHTCAFPEMSEVRSDDDERSAPSPTMRKPPKVRRWCTLTISSLSTLLLIGCLLVYRQADGHERSASMTSPSSSSSVHQRALSPQIETAKLYGSIHGYAYYFVDILIGSPAPQRQSVILDTGSTILAFPCKTCKDCGHHIDDPFAFTESTTAKWETCQPKCRCRDGKCSFYQGYTEGSSIGGFWFSDYVRIGDEKANNDAVKLHMGCTDEERKLFRSQKASGIVGVGPKRHGEHGTIIDALFSDQEGAVDTKVFSICLADKGGVLTVGGPNVASHRYYHAEAGATPEAKKNEEASHTIPPPTYTPIIDFTYYTISLLTASLEGDTFGSKGEWGSVIVDSGTTFTFFPPTIWKAFNNFFDAFCAKADNCKGTKKKIDQDTCWALKDKNDLATFPSLKLGFRGDAEVSWLPHSYMYQRFPETTYCLAIDDNGRRDTVLGMSFMIQRDVIFDVPNKRIGFADAECPRSEDRPPPPDHKPMPLYPKAHYYNEDDQKEDPLPHHPPDIPVEVTTQPQVEVATTVAAAEEEHQSHSVDTAGTAQKHAKAKQESDARASAAATSGASSYPTPPPYDTNLATGKKSEDASLGARIGVWTAALAGVIAIFVVMIVIICQSMRSKSIGYATMDSQLEEEEEALKEIQLSSFRGGYPGDVGFDLEEDDDDFEDSDEDYSSEDDGMSGSFEMAPQRIGKH